MNLESSVDGKFTKGPRITSPRIWLRSSWGLDGLSRYSYSPDGRNFTNFGEPYQLSWGDYRGDRLGIFTFNNTGDEGYVDCESFTYRYDSPATPPGSSTCPASR